MEDNQQQSNQKPPTRAEKALLKVIQDNSKPKEVETNDKPPLTRCQMSIVREMKSRKKNDKEKINSTFTDVFTFTD